MFTVKLIESIFHWVTKKIVAEQQLKIQQMPIQLNLAGHQVLTRRLAKNKH